MTVGEVSVNPFTLGVTIQGLEVKDHDGSRLAGWERLYVRLAPWKVLRGDVGPESGAGFYGCEEQSHIHGRRWRPSEAGICAARKRRSQ